MNYYPTAPGEYAVHILCDNEDIPNSPYIAHILPKSEFYPDKVEVFGPGVEQVGVIRNQPTNFTIDTRTAGQAPLDVKILDNEGKEIDVNITDKGDGTKICNYVPKDANKHTILVNYGSVSTKNSPYRVFVEESLNANNVFAFGPGVENGVKANVPTHFNVNCR